ncbi:MAG: mycothiol system anti-sigma-R factor [Gemmatimonadetes bacterium]|nr:mycothiol system anti-sigma-R factor [Gemmatimonadota bacterium]
MPSFGSPAEPLTCSSALRLLDEYVDNELPPHVAARIEAHLAGCDGCPKKLELERAFREVLRRQRERRAVPPGLRERVLDAIGQCWRIDPSAFWE